MKKSLNDMITEILNDYKKEQSAEIDEDTSGKIDVFVEAEPVYVVMGAPVAWARARTNNGRYYDSQAEIKEWFGWEIKRQMLQVLGISWPHTEPLHLSITFFMPIPRSYSKKKQAALEGHYHAKKPDCSNLIKFLEDALLGVLFKDDCIIASISAKKVYDVNPRTEFTLTRL